MKSKRFSGRFKKDKMKKGIYVLPNLFTTASMFSRVLFDHFLHE